MDNMTDFEKLKAQVKAQLQKIVNLEMAKYKEIADCKYTTIQGNKFFVGAEIWAAKKQAIRDTYDTKIKAAHDEIAALLDAAQKEANQEYAAAVPRPTADEWPEIQSMIQRYNNSTEPNKEREFIEQRDFHVENETRLARIYIFAGRDLGITKANADANAVSTDALAYEDQRLQAIHRATANITACIKLEEEELLLKIAPAMRTAQDHIDAVMDARRFYGVFEMLALQEKMRDMNPENFRASGMFTSYEEVKAARIAAKNRLFEMGADPDMDLVVFVNSDLQ